MLYIKLWGGLGNQLFQYVFGMEMAKKNNTECIFDTAFYKKQPFYNDKRIIEIQKIDPNIMLVDERKGIVKFLTKKVPNKLIRLFPAFDFKFKNIRFIKETRHKYLDILFNKKYTDNCYFDGYWQTEKYFVGQAKHIRELFNKFDYSTQTISLIQEIKSSNSVALHIRRGDFYSSILSHGVRVNDVYYKRAIEYIKSKVSSPHFYVFSDNIEWAKECDWLKCENVTFIENKSNNPAIEDMYCISQCKHGIMSASVFSWWGNWLRDSNDQIVIAPKGEYFNKDLLLDSWIKIDRF